MIFDPATFAAWRKRLAAGPRSQLHLAHAKQLCTELCDSDSPHYFDYRQRKRDLWRSREGNFRIPAHVTTLALTGAAADEPTWLDAARDALMTIVDERLAIDGLGDYTGWSGGKWPFHDAGKYYQMLGVVYDLLKPRLDDAQRQRLYGHVRELDPIIRRDIPQRQAYMENNQGARYMLGLLCMELAFAGDMSLERTSALPRAGHYIEKALRLNLGRDGAPREGHSYGTQSTLFYAVTADLVARGCGIDVTRDVRLHGVADYCLYDLIYSHGYVNPISDSSLFGVEQMVYFSAIRYRDAAHLWLWDQFCADDSHPYSALRTMREAPNMFSVPWVLLWPDDDAVEPKSPNETHRKWKHFRERGLVIARSGFDAESMHVTMHCGPNPQHWHSQADQNQVTLNALGRRWIIDPGYHVNDADGNRVMARYSDAHNNVHIDGVGQASKDSPDAYPRGDMVSACEANGEVVTVGDAREAYAASTCVSKALRTLRVSLDGSRASWVDEYETDDGKEHTYELTLLAEEDLKWEPAGDDCFALRDGDKRVTVTFAGSAPLSYRQGNYSQYPTLHIAQRGKAARFEVAVKIG